jgi:hypothetical protein
LQLPHSLHEHCTLMQQPALIAQPANPVHCYTATTPSQQQHTGRLPHCQLLISSPLHSKLLLLKTNPVSDGLLRLRRVLLLLLLKTSPSSEQAAAAADGSSAAPAALPAAPAQQQGWQPRPHAVQRLRHSQHVRLQRS